VATTTTDYGFNLPAVNSATDENVWGGLLNDNTTSLDGLFYTATNWVKRNISTSSSSNDC